MPDPRSTGAPPSGERLAKLLARAGVASRREVERMIAEGRVALDGKVIDTPATVLMSLAGVTVDGDPVAAPEPARLFLYHKPPGLLVTERDPASRPTIYDRLPRDLPRVVPVGRLDLNTEGLLLLTTDGGLKRQLELPATGVERAYRARAYGQVSQAQLEDLIDGVEIEGVRYGKIDANLERRTGANVWIEMILTEGKNREVRRVLEHLGLRVSRLIRTRYGPFVLGDLPAGEVGEVLGRDLEAFRANPKALPPARTTPSRELRAPDSLERRPRPERAGAGPRPTGDAVRSTRQARPVEPERSRAPAGERVQRSARTDTTSTARPARPPRPDARGPGRRAASGDTDRRSPSAARRTANFDRPVGDRSERVDQPARRGAGSPRPDDARGRRSEATDRTFAPRPPQAARTDRTRDDARPGRSPCSPASGARPPRGGGTPHGDRPARPSGGDRPTRGPSGGRGHPPRKR